MNLETPVDIAMTRQLERLACGELDEAAQEPLLTWLEADPRRWRLCGIAFLEAQAWSGALGEWGASPRELPVRRMDQPQAEIESRSSNWRVARIAGLAAGLLFAFVLGWNARPMPSLTAGDVPSGAKGRVPTTGSVGGASEAVLASLSVQSPLGAAPPTTIHIPVVPSSSQTVVNRLDEVPDYVRQQWERRGYRVTTERRYLFAKLPDGQQVVVPVEQLLVRAVPAEVY